MVALGLLGVVVLLAVSTIDGLTRPDGYSVEAHWVSLLSRGSRAWLGTLNLAISGALVLVGAIGMMRAASCRGGDRWMARWVGALGVSMLVAALFPVDPVPSYPPGSPTVAPSISGQVHSLAGVGVLVSLAGACLAGATARASSTRSRVVALSAGAVTVASVTACVVLAVARGTQRWDEVYAGLFQRVALLAGCAWVAAHGIRLMRRGPRMDRAPEVIDLTTSDELHGRLEAAGVDGAGHQDELVDARRLGIVESEE